MVLTVGYLDPWESPRLLKGPWGPPFPKYLFVWGCILFSSVRLLSCVRLFVTPWAAACQASLPITNSWSLLKLMSIESVMLSNSKLGTYWPGEFIFQCSIFLPFHTVHGVLKARILQWFPFPSPVDHILPELSTMTHPSWVALHSMAHSFIELDKAVVHVIRLVSFLWLWFSVCLPSDGEG